MSAIDDDYEIMVLNPVNSKDEQVIQKDAETIKLLQKTQNEKKDLEKLVDALQTEIKKTKVKTNAFMIVKIHLL